jgi:succinoglycan biosynthesis protein ExoO
MTVNGEECEMPNNESVQSVEEPIVPDVSVIMPAYNTAAYIETAIASALNQTLTNIEVVVVDDASVDETVEVVKRIADPRVKLVCQPENGGAAVARNRAIDEARGRWIAVLDSDDWYAPDRLEKLLHLACETGADMVADDLYYVADGESSPWTTLIRRSGEQVTETIQIDPAEYVRSDVPEHRGLHLGFSKPLIKRDFLVKHNIRYRDEVRMGQDFFFYLQCLAYGATFLLHPNAYYFYRARPGSLITKSQLDRLEQACHGIADILKREPFKNNPDLVEALRYKLQVCKQLRAYYRVVEPLKEKKFMRALIEMGRNPYFFVRFITQVPRVITERFAFDRSGHSLSNKAT